MTRRLRAWLCHHELDCVVLFIVQPDPAMVVLGYRATETLAVAYHAVGRLRPCRAWVRTAGASAQAAIGNQASKPRTRGVLPNYSCPEFAALADAEDGLAGVILVG